MVDQSITRLAQLGTDLPDKRTGKNIQYQMSDIVKAGFAVFFTQSPSFLARQRALKKSKGSSNAETVFQMDKIPCDEHIRKMLDPVPPSHFYEEFHTVLGKLQHQGKLEPYRVLGGRYTLISLDGTEYFSSYEICCPNCLQRKRNNGQVQYYHTVILPVIVAPDNPHVISLPPEYISPQDGQEKQDCERAASKRWIEAHGSRYTSMGAILLGDDLYANQPLCQHALAHNLHFLFVCKPDSHTTLYEWVNGILAAGKEKTVSIRKWNGRYRERWTYRFIQDVPLRAGDDGLRVNWVDLQVTHDETNESLYHNSWVTDLTVTNGNVIEIANCGRSRWKGENENNNVLKTNGYHLKHNFGHGSEYLSMTLLTLNLFAFLLHTATHLTDKTYRLIREELGRRETFFHDVRALTRYMFFDSWGHLLEFMYVQLEIDPAPD
ncbi:MAG: ISNCY family transposase [Sphaerospermopsis sp. SIO1G2]|nr:ISNCY family transposase [Sphaerospermopsis sp. SIO1G2]